MSPTPPDPPPRRIGLFGGSFDPVHVGHLALARAARDQLRLDEVRWLPAGRPWQKGRALAPSDDRAAMVALAIAGEPAMRLDRRELDRDGPSYMVDTVRSIAAEAPGAELFLVIGQDQYARLDTWHDVGALLGLVTVAVAAREGVAPSAPAALARVPHRRAVIDLPPVAVSSTLVRAAVAAGRPPGSAVPHAVASYIARHDLYTKAP